MAAIISKYQKILQSFTKFDFVPILAVRLFLAPIFLSAGFSKLYAFDSTVSWFGNEDWGLGLPLPWLMAILATATEILGGFALLIGVSVRLICVPLIVTMLIAIVLVHWENGWFAIAPSNADTSMAKVLVPVGFPGAAESLQNSAEVNERLHAAKSILKSNGNYQWLTEKGQFVILNNGIEFAVTYLVMLLILAFYGAGRYVSVDYWLQRKYLEANRP